MSFCVSAITFACDETGDCRRWTTVRGRGLPRARHASAGAPAESASEERAARRLTSESNLSISKTYPIRCRTVTGTPGANRALHPLHRHGALEPLDDFECTLNAAEPVTEGDEIQRGCLGAADGKRCREPPNLGERRELEFRLHVEVEVNFPDGDRPPWPAQQHLRNLDGLVRGAVQGRGREQPYVIKLALRAQVRIEPGGDGRCATQPMLGRDDQEGRRAAGKPGRARREPLELSLRGDPRQSASFGRLVNRHDEVSARLQVVE